MRRKGTPVLSIEGLATIANLSDELKSVLEKELARRAAKDKVSFDEIRSAIECYRIKLATRLMHSWTTPPHRPPRQITALEDMVAKVMEEIRQGGKLSENPAPD